MAVAGAEEPQVALFVHLPNVHRTDAAIIAKWTARAEKAVGTRGGQLPNFCGRLGTAEIFVRVLRLVVVDGIHGRLILKWPLAGCRRWPLTLSRVRLTR